MYKIVNLFRSHITVFILHVFTCFSLLSATIYKCSPGDSAYNAHHRSLRYSIFSVDFYKSVYHIVVTYWDFILKDLVSML